MKIQSLPSRGTTPMTKAMTTLALLGALGTAQAAIFTDPQLEALHDAGKYAELEQLAKGDKAQAKVAYERFIANKRAMPANVEEVQKSLVNLAKGESK